MEFYRRYHMAFLNNHAKTIVNKATQYSHAEQIKKEYWYLPFEGEGFIPGDKQYDYESITWTEIRPIYRLTRKGELKLLGGIKYYVDKFAENAEHGVWHPAHYHFRGLMTPKGYRKALKEDTENRTKEGLTKRLDKLSKASAKERKARETAVKQAVKSGKKRSEVNVQNLHDEEGRVRGRKLAEILKNKTR